jgi:hypothetical protein
MVSLILSTAIMAVAMRFWWQGASPTPAKLPAQKQARQAAHPAVATEEALPKQSRPWQSDAASPDEESAGTETARPQAPAKIILSDPYLLPPFPTEHNVQPGMPRERLIEAFGKPDLSAHTRQQQRIFETYVYKQQGRATFVLLQDGSVVSAYTGRVERHRAFPPEPPQ